MRRRALASVLAAAAVAAVSVVAAVPSSQAAPALKYVALGDSYSAASGVLPVDPNAPVNCLRSTRNYPKVIAGRIGANLQDVTCGAAETKRLLHGAVPERAAAARRAEQGHPARHDDHRRQRQQRVHQHDPAVRHRRALHGRPGQPLQGQVRLVLPGHAPHQDLPRPREDAEGRARQGARGEGRDPELPVDHAEDGRLLRQDADRHG